MDKKEQEMMENIKQISEETKVPESLKPENIEGVLKRQPKKFLWKKSWVAMAAACVVLVCGIWYGGRGLEMKDGMHSPSGAAGESGNTGLEQAESYEQIYAYLEKAMEEQEKSAVDGGAVMYSDAGSVGDRAVMEEAGMGAKGAENVSASYSDTNVRQEGVDEGDVVKTDGRFIYTLKDSGTEITVVDTADRKLSSAATITEEELNCIFEFYVSDGKLVLVGEKNIEMPGKKESSVTPGCTVMVTYDLADPANPERLGEVSQSGIYTSSRMEGGHLYLFSLYHVYQGGDIGPGNPKEYVPVVNGEVMLQDDIYLPPAEKACMYELITSVDLNEPEKVKSSKAIFTDGGELYVSNQNIYWYEREYSGIGNSITTNIRRLSYEDGKITGQASGKVSGYIHDSFCIDEYDGYLRVITTENETNSVYVLDQELKETGSIKGLAKDERVYSARFMGDTGYFVTFRETDPLFSVDFSNPEKPEIVGELKIPGFSEYLHVYGEGKLLGIGMDADEDGMTNGVKLSMFDISDNANVKEEQKHIMENIYSAEVMYDYKAALIDAERNIIGFSAQDGNGEKYFVFSYDEAEGFRCLMEEEVNGGSYQAARGLYIDQILYVVKGNIIEAYDMNGYQKIGDIIL